MEKLRTKHIGCIGRDVPVKIDVEGELQFRDGTITVLDSKQEINGETRGLFLDGAVLLEPIKRVLTIGNGVRDVNKLVRASYMAWDKRSNFNNDILLIEHGDNQKIGRMPGGRLVKRKT